jgi:hypothetical protein
VKKTATVDSDDEANSDEEEGDAEGEDQVDEYECLQEQRETDRLVSHNMPRSWLKTDLTDVLLPR